MTKSHLQPILSPCCVKAAHMPTALLMTRAQLQPESSQRCVNAAGDAYLSLCRIQRDSSGWVDRFETVLSAGANVMAAMRCKRRSATCKPSFICVCTAMTLYQRGQKPVCILHVTVSQDQHVGAHFAISLLQLLYCDGEDGVRPAGVLVHQCCSHTSVLLAHLHQPPSLKVHSCCTC